MALLYDVAGAEHFQPRKKYYLYTNVAAQYRKTLVITAFDHDVMIRHEIQQLLV